MEILSVIPEKIKTAGRILFNGQATGVGDSKGVKPAGSNGLTLLCLVTMANAADLVLTVQTGDDADLTNPVDIADNIPIFKNDIRQTDAKTLTVDDDSGLFVVVFNVPPILIPTDKYCGITFGNSNAANILSSIALDDTYHEMGPSA